MAPFFMPSTYSLSPDSAESTVTFLFYCAQSLQLTFMGAWLRSWDIWPSAVFYDFIGYLFATYFLWCRNQIKFICEPPVACKHTFLTWYHHIKICFIITFSNRIYPFVSCNSVTMPNLWITSGENISLSKLNFGMSKCENNLIFSV